MSTARKQPPPRARLIRLAAWGMATAFGLGGAGAAQAADITAEGAQQLQQQLHDWLENLLGPNAGLGEHPVQVTAAGDHYQMESPLPGALFDSGVSLTGKPVSGMVKPLDGGRWAIEGLQLPSPLTISYPGTGPENSGGGEVTATIDSQEQHAVVDPSFATESSWEGKLKGYTSSMQGKNGAGARTTHIDTMTVRMSWISAADGRIDVTQSLDNHLLTSSTVVPDVGLVSFSADAMRGTVLLNGVAPEGLATIIRTAMDMLPMAMSAARAAGGADPKQAMQARHALSEANRKQAEDDKAAAEADKKAVQDGRLSLADRKKNTEARHQRALARQQAMQALKAAPPAPAADAGPALSPEQRKSVQAALLAALDLMDGFDEQGSVENLTMVGGGYTGKLARFGVGIGIAAPDGKLGLHLNVTMDGLDSPVIPPGIYRDYLPHHVGFSPRVGGLPAAEVRALLQRAIQSEGDDPALEADAEALVAQNPVTVGLDDVALDLGPSALKANGEVRVRGKEDFDGAAHLEITGLDKLIKQSNTVPELKQAAPVLIMLKGIGLQTGDVTVWDVTYKDGQVMVNGNDMSALIPGK